MPRKGRVTPENRPRNRIDELIGSTEPLLALFAVVDDVLSEPDALDGMHARAGLGRIWREYKKTCEAFGKEYYTK
jgi:hypothetical protein